MTYHHTNIDQNINQDLYGYYPPSKTRYVSNKEIEGMGFLATVDEFTKVLLTEFDTVKVGVTNLVNDLINFANQTIGEPVFKYEIQSLSGLGTILVKMELTSSGDRLIMSKIVHLNTIQSSRDPHVLGISRNALGLHGFNPHVPGTQAYFQHEAQMRYHQPYGVGQHQPGLNHPLFSGPHHEHNQPYPRDPSQRYQWTPDEFDPNQPSAYEFSDEVEYEEKEEIQTESFDVDDGNSTEANEATDNDESKEQ